MPEDATTGPTLGLGPVVGRPRHGFRPGEVIAQDADVQVYVATALQPPQHGHSPAETVGDAVFVVVLRPEEVDHVVPVGLGGTNDRENALALCHSCHLAKTRAERAAFGLNRDKHREYGLSLREAQARRFTLSGFLAELAQRTGWTLHETAD